MSGAGWTLDNVIDEIRWKDEEEERQESAFFQQHIMKHHHHNFGHFALMKP